VNSRRNTRYIELAVIFLMAVLWVGCESLIQKDAPEKKFKKTDYLNDFAGVYAASLPGAAEMGRMVTLILYPDGTCLLAEKDLGQPPATVTTGYGRWDHSDFPDRIDLRLNSKTGGRRLVEFETGENRLIHSGDRFGKDGLTLIRRGP
jgi:hypothetical protein